MSDAVPGTDKSAGKSDAEPATRAFQAEVSRLLDIVANALYSNRDIFLRELISNGADACDRLRYLALTEPELLSGDSDFGVELRPDAANRRLEIRDSGVGMNRDELIENLGTIAHSGSAKFLSQLGDKKTEVDLIGQFGVGFYSAFMVADRVEVFTRRAGEQHGWRWESDGRGGFTVEESEDAPLRGTRILLHLKEDAGDYAEPQRLRHIVKTYSDHISVAVKLVAGDEEPETLNAAGALWARPKSEITEEQYKQFYHDTAHAFDAPWHTLHFKAEGVIEYSGLLFIPSTRPLDLFDPGRRGSVKLYVKRVFITDDCAEVVPTWLRFLRGVVDSEDLPLNVSRELLQNNPVLAKIRQGLTKRVLSELEKKAEKAPEAYIAFWETFGPVLKEGLYEDSGQDETLLKLARFKSTTSDLGEGSGDGGWTTLADYATRMPEGQEAIYILAGDDLEQLARSPQLEGFRAKGIEVLLLTDPIDEFWTVRVGAYQDKPFRSVTRAGAELDEIGKDEESEDKSAEDAGGGIEALLAMLRLSLQGKVKDVRASKRLTDSPVCLVADEGDIDLHLARLLKQHQRLDDTPTRILELNPKHPLVAALSETATAGQAGAGGTIEDVGLLLLDQARILEGEPPLDPAAFSRRLADLVAKGLG